MLAVHRVPPQLMGIMPNNIGEFVNVEKENKVFVRNELVPLQEKLKELNNDIGHKTICFREYSFEP
jgi:capsid portal protein